MNHIAEHHDAGKNCKFEITLGHTASISCEWKDQGWGNQKGTVLVMGNNGVAPSECAPRHDVIAEKGPAPPKELEPNEIVLPSRNRGV